MSIEWRMNLPFGRLKERVAAAADAAVMAGVAHLQEIVDPLVPVETGRLLGSGEIGPGRKAGVGPAGDHVAHLYFPGPYALYQHEGVYFRRPAHFGAALSHTHGQSFFLIQPAVTHTPEIIGTVRRTVLREARW